IKGDLIIVENRAEHPFIAVCDAFHQGIAAAVTLHAVTAALRAAQPTDRLTPIHEILRRFTAPPLRTALTLVEPASGGLSLRLAGNPRPVVIRQGRPSECAGPKGEPLGVSQAASVERLSVDLEPGDLLIVSTNGLTKALSASGAAGFDGLTGPAAQGVEEVHAALQERLSGLPGLSTFPDDISYVIIQRRTHS
ncbi:MAG TPA: SpoIIE family protein phosphatase, partial [Candidatus Ozemobacteraceae bacterium]|nr:SpoIIE family protein phosphatase [Candidatus Ozemobacteraceae bacterium]